MLLVSPKKKINKKLNKLSPGQQFPHNKYLYKLSVAMRIAVLIQSDSTKNILQTIPQPNHTTYENLIKIELLVFEIFKK